MFAIVLPAVTVRGRESTLEAEGLRQFGRRVGVGPQAK
jgi:hypothetical protein